MLTASRDDALAMLDRVITQRSQAIDDAPTSDVGRTWLRWERACDLAGAVGKSATVLVRN